VLVPCSYKARSLSTCWRGLSFRPSLIPEIAVALLEAFLAAVVLALVVTVTSVPAGTRYFAVGAVGPVILLSVLFVLYCRRVSAWSHAGASVLGALGVAIRLAVSTRPSLEVGGGLPLVVSAFYVGLGAAVSVVNCLAFRELRRSRGRSDRQAPVNHESREERLIDNRNRGFFKGFRFVGS